MQAKTLSGKEMKIASDLIRDGLKTDGAHHKQWFLEAIATLLDIPISPYNDPETERGRPPEWLTGTEYPGLLLRSPCAMVMLRRCRRTLGKSR